LSAPLEVEREVDRKASTGEAESRSAEVHSRVRAGSSGVAKGVVATGQCSGSTWRQERRLMKPIAVAWNIRIAREPRRAFGPPLDKDEPIHS